MFKFLFFILFLTFINSNTYAADDLNEGNWVGLYLPKEMIDDKLKKIKNKNKYN